MVTIEQVEKLRKHTGVSYEEAKKALEETNGDVLEAVINLEKQNRIKPPNEGGQYQSSSGQQQNSDSKINETSDENQSNSNSTSFGEMIGRFFRWFGKIVHKGNTNSFKVMKDNEKIMAIPLTAMVLLLIFAFWLVIPLVIIGLFFGYRYWFEGPEVSNPSVNRAMDSVADAAESLKKDFTNGMNDKKGE
ncbi:DUF4342 domain-containing protein [Desulfuribacillus alkaliarsenatis]|uniref:Ubiquitin n=1 Tax=Desulfuribacillus alkaliarsenatis TaxID=766136 RepID=A0A1E5G328_9FIRM|nr:DUF4342 domain-containing protein [Desulfuribacillus alkaliarsenatis]OEF97384.1 ubiquitin [Desulfuribacillus alkaliarsenatis]